MAGDASDVLSAISNEECSVASEILDRVHSHEPPPSPSLAATTIGRPQQPPSTAPSVPQLDIHGQPIHVADIIQDLESDQLGHIDSPETSDTTDALHGDESLMDDMSSVLGQDMFGADASLTEDTTTCAAAPRPHSCYSAARRQRRRRRNRPNGDR